MTDSPSPTTSNYYPGYGSSNTDGYARRRLDTWAGFVLPHLRPGMRLLDVGCGPGSITCDLAATLAPGEVVGVDLEPSQVERAAVLARERGLTNARFDLADATALPFPDAAFDVVFAHAVLHHLQDPLAALREFRRVLRPGGVVAVKDALDRLITDPSATALNIYWDLFTRALPMASGEVNVAGRRNRREQLGQAGFVSVTVAVEPLNCDTSERLLAGIAAPVLQLREPSGPIAIALGEGWADRETLRQLATEIAAWAETPGAFFASLWLSATGRVSDRP